MADIPTPFSVTSDRQTLALSAAKAKDTFTVKIRNEGIVADTVNVGVEAFPGTAEQANPAQPGQAADQPPPAPLAVDPAWFTVEGAPLPIQWQVPPGTDVLVPITVTLPVGGHVGAERLEYTFRPYVWSAVRPPRETTVYGPVTTLTIDAEARPPWWRRYWWLLAIAGLVLLVAIAATVIVVLSDEPEKDSVNAPPVARLAIFAPDAPTTFDEVTADFSQSSDDGGSLTGTIDWGDENRTVFDAPGTLGHTYSEPGTYKVVLSVNDGEKSATDDGVITVALPGFDGTWEPAGSPQVITLLGISGFDGQTARVTVVYRREGRTEFLDPLSATLNGQTLVAQPVRERELSAQLSMQLAGNELIVASEWDFGLLGGGQRTDNNTFVPRR